MQDLSFQDTEETPTRCGRSVAVFGVRLVLCEIQGARTRMCTVSTLLLLIVSVLNAPATYAATYAPSTHAPATPEYGGEEARKADAASDTLEHARQELNHPFNLLLPPHVSSSFLFER